MVQIQYTRLLQWPLSKGEMGVLKKELDVALRLRFGISQPVQPTTVLRRTPVPVANSNKDVLQCVS